jgi:hypothetical protein
MGRKDNRASQSIRRNNLFSVVGTILELGCVS